MSDESVTAGPAAPSSGLLEAEARLYGALSIARLEQRDDLDTHIAVTDEELATLTGALEDLDELRRRARLAGVAEALRLADDAVLDGRSLADAADAVESDLIGLALAEGALTPAHAEALDALTASLERLRRLAGPPAQRVGLEQVAADAAELLNAIADAGISREHLTGRLEALQRPLETLETDLARLERGLA